MVVGGESGGAHGHNIALEWLADAHVSANVLGGTNLHAFGAERLLHSHDIALEWLADAHVGTNMAGGANFHAVAVERLSDSKIVTLEAWSHILGFKSDVGDFAGSIGSVLDLDKSSEDGLEEDIELRVLLDVLNAVSVSAEHSLEFLLGGLSDISSGARLLDGEGKMSIDDDLVDITTSSGSLDNLFDNLLLDSLVGDLSDNLVLGDGLDLFGVLFVDFSDFFLTLLEDFLNLLGGIRNIVGVLNNLNGLFIGFFNDILNLLLLFLLGILNTILLNLLVVSSEGLEAVLDLIDDSIELLLGAHVGDSLEGDTILKSGLGVILRLSRISRLFRHIKDNNLV